MSLVCPELIGRAVEVASLRERVDAMACGRGGVIGLVAGGNRRLRFRGTSANDLWLHHRVAGLNLRRLLNLGLTRFDGAWVLA